MYSRQEEIICKILDLKYKIYNHHPRLAAALGRDTAQYNLHFFCHNKYMAKNIRTAMFRVDNHFYHFASVLTKIDMIKLRELSPECHYWFTDCYDPMTVVPKVASGIQVASIGDYNTAKSEAGATLFAKGPRICKSPKDLVRDVDAAFICNCDGDSSDHLKLAGPLIRKGIPTFIDKPFALKTKDALAMVKLAKRYRTPIYSSSLLSVASAVDNMRKQVKQISGMETGVVNGAPGWATPSGQEGVIHGVSLLQAVFGYDIKWVSSSGDYPAHYTAVGYESGMQVSMFLNQGMMCYTAEIFGRNRDPNPNTLYTGAINNMDFSVGASIIAHRFKRMVKTGKPPRDYDEMISNVAVCEAAARSWKLGRKVKINEVWKQ
jgi:predicted dehydrogenase